MTYLIQRSTASNIQDRLGYSVWQTNPKSPWMTQNRIYSSIVLYIYFWSSGRLFSLKSFRNSGQWRSNYLKHCQWLFQRERIIREFYKVIIRSSPEVTQVIFTPSHWLELVLRPYQLQVEQEVQWYYYSPSSVSVTKYLRLGTLQRK